VEKPAYYRNSDHAHTAIQKLGGQVVEDNKKEQALLHRQRGTAMNEDKDTIGGYAIPVDPMDFLQCDSCQ
jgi:hypothetical protein